MCIFVSRNVDLTPKYIKTNENSPLYLRCSLGT